MRTDALIAACHSKACAPPPVGSGGSTKGGAQRALARVWGIKQAKHRVMQGKDSKMPYHTPDMKARSIHRAAQRYDERKALKKRGYTDKQIREILSTGSIAPDPKSFKDGLPRPGSFSAISAAGCQSAACAPPPVGSGGSAKGVRGVLARAKAALMAPGSNMDRSGRNSFDGYHSYEERTGKAAPSPAPAPKKKSGGAKAALTRAWQRVAGTDAKDAAKQPEVPPGSTLDDLLEVRSRSKRKPTPLGQVLQRGVKVYEGDVRRAIDHPRTPAEAAISRAAKSASRRRRSAIAVAASAI